MSERREAVVPMYFEGNEGHPAQRTFVCFGVPRGGTSAIAGTMQRLGVWIGDDLTDNYEDADFVRRTVPHMVDAVRQRNEQRDVWGFKCPDAVNYLDRIIPEIRNPYLVVVYRDVVATMKGHMRWHERNHLHSFHEVIIQQHRNWFLIERWKVPTALVSYEKAVTYPRVFAHALSHFMGVGPVTNELGDEIAEFMRPGSYK